MILLFITFIFIYSIILLYLNGERKRYKSLSEKHLKEIDDVRISYRRMMYNEERLMTDMREKDSKLFEARREIESLKTKIDAKA